MIPRVRIFVVAALVVFGGFACARREDPAAVRGTTVVMAVPNIEVLKPDKWDLDFLTFLPMAKLNEHGELEGHLAQSWEHSADHREYTFHLRPGVRWDDGVAVTAHDVKFTFDLLNHPDVAEYPWVDATVIDDSTVRIRAAKPGYINDVVYYPQHLLKDLDPKDFWAWSFWTHPVGNGPFRFVQYVPETMIEFEANPDYYGKQPGIERLILKFVGEAGFTELLAGNVDIRREGDPMEGGQSPLYRPAGPPGSHHGTGSPGDARVRQPPTRATDHRRGVHRAPVPAPRVARTAAV